MTHVQLQSRGPQRSSTDAEVSRMDHDHQLSPQMNTRASFFCDSPSSIFRPGIAGSGRTESRASVFGRKLRFFFCLHIEINGRNGSMVIDQSMDRFLNDPFI